MISQIKDGHINAQINREIMNWRMNRQMGRWIDGQTDRIKTTTE